MKLDLNDNDDLLVNVIAVGVLLAIMASYIVLSEPPYMIWNMPMPTKFTKASFPRGLERNQILVPHLESYDKWDQPWDFKYEPKEDDDAWHPSGDCLPDPATLYISKRDDERRVIRPTLQRTFLVGHFWHQVIQKVIVELGYAAPEDIERTGMKVWGTTIDYPSGKDYTDHVPAPYHWARGQGDIAPLTMPRWSGICDIKTMNTTDWHESEKTGLLPLRFADKYTAQLNVYMDLFDMERALILAVNKDSSRFIEFQFERNQILIDQIYEKWAYVGDCILDGTEPTEKFPLTF